MPKKFATSYKAHLNPSLLSLPLLQSPRIRRLRRRPSLRLPRQWPRWLRSPLFLRPLHIRRWPILLLLLLPQRRLSLRLRLHPWQLPQQHQLRLLPSRLLRRLRLPPRRHLLQRLKNQPRLRLLLLPVGRDLRCQVARLRANRLPSVLVSLPPVVLLSPALPLRHALLPAQLRLPVGPRRRLGRPCPREETVVRFPVQFLEAAVL